MTTNKSNQNPRLLALKMLEQVVIHRHSLTDVELLSLKTVSDIRSKSLCREMTYGVCRWYFLLKSQSGYYLRKPLKEKDVDVLLIILLGMYQIRFMRISDHAAINETVKLTGLRKKPWAKGLVNAVLRNYLRDMPENNEERNQMGMEQHRAANPLWLINLLQQNWTDHIEQLIPALNARAAMILRIDTSQVSVDDYLSQLSEVDILADRHLLVETAIVLKKPVEVALLPEFETGLVSVQDAATQLAAQLLDCKPGMKVLDACAAPGGKTMHILQHTKDVDVTALDINATRLQLIEQNLQRIQLSAKLITGDACNAENWFDGYMFDRILLDVPCSASGVIRRHPDIRLLRRESDLEKLVKVQTDIFKSCWRLLKQGGVMLYCTCSIFKLENEWQIGKILQQYPDCIELPINSVTWGQPAEYGRQILPGPQNMDGFYYAKLMKTGHE